MSLTGGLKGRKVNLGMEERIRKGAITMWLSELTWMMRKSRSLLEGGSRSERTDADDNCFCRPYSHRKVLKGHREMYRW